MSVSVRQSVTKSTVSSNSKPSSQESGNINILAAMNSFSKRISYTTMKTPEQPAKHSNKKLIRHSYIL